MWPSWMKYALGAVAGLATLFVVRKLSSGSTSLECDDSIQAIHHGGVRDMSHGRIRLIVLHSTEGDTALGGANWFASEASGGSAHVLVDDDSCYRALPDDVVPWGAKGDSVNEDGLHVEQAGWARWSRDEWLAHMPTIQKAAAIARRWASEYDVPLVFLTADDLRAQGDSARGITTHREVTKAYDVAGGHQDPGADYPIDVFMNLVGGWRAVRQLALAEAEEGVA